MISKVTENLLRWYFDYIKDQDWSILLQENMSEGIPILIYPEMETSLLVKETCRCPSLELSDYGLAGLAVFGEE